MGEITGRFVWQELHTTDVAAATAFYTGVVSWTALESATGEKASTVFKASDNSTAAAVEAVGKPDTGPEDGGWVSYLGVDEIDATIDHAVRLGAAVRRSPVDIPGVGRSAILADPQGAVFGILTPEFENQAGDQPSRSGSGHFAWRELYTRDPDAAFDFYAGIVGWQRDRSFDMGPAGSYQLFSVDGVAAGGIMRAPPHMRQPTWNSFIQVEDIAGVEARVAARNGQVFDGLREVPGGDFTVKCFDAQGHMFAMTGRPRKA